MTDPIRTWTIVLNNEFSDNSQDVQFQEGCFALKQLLVAASWVVTQSFNGTTLDASDNWATAADVSFGTVGNGAWIILLSPVGWLTNGEQLELLLFVSEDLALNDAQIAPVKIAPKGYNSDGAVSDAATASIDFDDAGSAVVVLDTETVTLDDGPNVAVVFEFDTDDSVIETATLRKVDISAAVDDDDVRDAFISAVNSAPLLNTIASIGGAGVADFVQRVHGTTGNTTISHTVASGDFAPTNFSGGTNGSLPTPDGIETLLLSGGDDMIPWNAPAIGRYTTWRSSRGDIKFGVKRQGEQFFTHFMMLLSNEDDNGGGTDDQRWMFFARSSATLNVLESTNLSNASNWRGVSPAGVTAISTASAQSAIWGWSSLWSSGVNSKGETHDVPIDVGHNSALGSSPRHLGQLIDIYAAPANIPFGALHDSERGQTQRRVSMGSGVWIFAPTADLPFQ